jgi:hypothetical protein
MNRTKNSLRPGAPAGGTRAPGAGARGLAGTAGLRGLVCGRIAVVGARGLASAPPAVAGRAAGRAVPGLGAGRGAAGRGATGVGEVVLVAGRGVPALALTAPTAPGGAVEGLAAATVVLGFSPGAFPALIGFLVR